LNSILENYKWILGVAIIIGLALASIVFINDYKLKKQEKSVYYEDKAIFEGFYNNNITLALNYLKKVPKDSYAYKRAKFLEYKYTDKEKLKNFLNEQNFLALNSKDIYTGYLIDKKEYKKALDLASSVSLNDYIFPDTTLYGFESALFVDKNMAKDFYAQIQSNFPNTLYQAIAFILALENNLTLNFEVTK